MITLTRLESNDVPVGDTKLAFKQSGKTRADFLTNILLYKEAKVIELEHRSAFTSNNEAIVLELAQQNEELEIALHSSKSSVTMIASLGLEASDQQALLEQVQRHLNADILDVDVAYSLIEETLCSFQLWMVDKAPSLTIRLLLFLAILLQPKRLLIWWP